jgi:hypothetical protein
MQMLGLGVGGRTTAVGKHRKGIKIQYDAWNKYKWWSHSSEGSSLSMRAKAVEIVMNCPESCHVPLSVLSCHM